jgi:hypothetical protein
VTDELAEGGWAAQATPVEGGSVRCEACGETVPAGDLQVESLHRVEGASDPDDMAAVIAVRCPRCSTGATLVLMYGPEASGADADVLLALPDAPEPRESGIADEAANRG